MTKKAKALFEYKAENDDELSLSKGDVITIVKEEIYDGWHEGELNGAQGVFPSNFVEVFEEAEEQAPPPVVKRMCIAMRLPFGQACAHDARLFLIVVVLSARSMYRNVVTKVQYVSKEKGDLDITLTLLAIFTRGATQPRRPLWVFSREALATL